MSNTVYDHYGRTAREEYGAFNQKVYNSYEYDEHTSALTDQITDRDTAPQRIDAAHYTHDQAGNVTSIADTTGQDTAAVTDTQCFTTDALRRITQAWTTGTGSQCSDGPSPTTVGGPDAYWTTYGYDTVGNRTTETQHTTTSGPATDTTRTYTAPATGTHNLPQVTQTGTNPHTDTYTYDADGNTATRTLGATPQQTLDLGPPRPPRLRHPRHHHPGLLHLRRRRQPPHRQRRHRHHPLPARRQRTPPQARQHPVGTRYYDYNGKTVALRTGGKLTYLIADPHGTATTQIDATTQAVTRRKTTIFGAPRGTAGTVWQGTKGFVGGTTDTATGLTHLGAREYDPDHRPLHQRRPPARHRRPPVAERLRLRRQQPRTALSDPTGLYTCRNGHEGCDEHGNTCSYCSAWDTQMGDCVHTECGPSQVNQNPGVSLKTQRDVRDVRIHCTDLCVTLGIESPQDPRWQDFWRTAYGGDPGPPPQRETWAASHAQDQTVAFGRPSYSYETSEYIGPNSLGTPEDVMAFFKAHPQQVFPFKVTGCGSFTQDATCILHPGDSIMHGLGKIAGGPGEVRVSIKDKTSVHVHRAERLVLR